MKLELHTKRVGVWRRREFGERIERMAGCSNCTLLYTTYAGKLGAKSWRMIRAVHVIAAADTRHDYDKGMKTNTRGCSMSIKLFGARVQFW